MNNDVKQLAQALRAQIKTTDRPAIHYQTGPDESVLIGSRDSVLRFALALIESVETLEESDMDGVRVEESSAIQGSLDPLGEFGLDWVIIPPDDESREAIIDRYYR